MKHRVAGRKLGRTSEHRLALLRNLSTALFRSDTERITTTLAKAKELRPFVERLITLSKRETLHARRAVLRHIRDDNEKDEKGKKKNKAMRKLFDVLSARYAQRPGGYTRILKLGPRRGDHAEMAIVELVGAEDAAAKARAEAAASKSEAAGKGGRSAKTKASKAPTPSSEAAPAEDESKRRKTKAPGRKKASRKKEASGAESGSKAKKKTKSTAKRRGSKSGDED